MSGQIVLYNTMSRRKERLETIEPGKIRMYVCGVTPYDSAHIGHAMSVVVFDMIRRYLEHRGFAVHHAQNFTDIDDKIIARANREGIPAAELTERLIADWHRETAALNVMPATIYPRATTEIPAIVRMVETLVTTGYAYEVSGDVYFRVRTFREYGKLSHRKLEDLLAGARIEVDERKEDPLDFALWKATKPGEPSWPSPWSAGRPGWHIECSAMCANHLGGQVDIHGGGADLIFPHHENEIAQSEAAMGCAPFARYWMHNGLLQFSGDKMSKSIGNIVRISDLIERDLTGAFRLMVLQSHYRAPLTYSEDALEAAARGLERLVTAAEMTPVPTSDGDASKPEIDLAALVREVEERFHASMDDDFDTPVAIAQLFELARGVNRSRTSGADAEELATAVTSLTTLGSVLGLQLEGAEEDRSDFAAKPFIDLLVEVRDELRAAKHWELSDRIRDEIAALGISIADNPQGSTWKRSR